MLRVQGLSVGYGESQISGMFTYTSLKAKLSA
jgi:hypothetical protein